MDFNFRQAINWIKGNWLGVIIGYLIIAGIIYGAIWFFIEPLDIPAKEGFLKNILTTRWGNHIFSTLFLASHITLILTIIFQKTNKQQLKNIKILYSDATPTPFDFEAKKQKKWDINTNSRIGKSAEGEFRILDHGVLSIKRTNSEGEFQLKLISYTYDYIKNHFIKKDITKDSIRNIQIKCEIRLSNRGSQEMRFGLKNNENSSWIEWKKVIVAENQWRSLNLFFAPQYDKDFFIRIDSRKVEQPPNEIQIKNLTVIEY